MDIAAAKTALPLPALLHRLGVESPDKDRFVMPCPLHDEQTGKSFSVERKNGEWVWNCFGKCARGGDEITFLEMHEHLSVPAATRRFIEMAGGNGAPPVRRAPTQSKSTSAANSQSCLTPLSEKDLKRIGDWRGYSEPFMRWLHEQKLIGAYKTSIAFPVIENGRVVGAHYRVKDGSWRYAPTGTKTQPLVIGELIAGDLVHVFESQWDALAFMDKSGERSGLVITRGASNGALVANPLPDRATVYAWTQNDPAGAKWEKDICANTKTVVKRVKIPPPHKDLNAWTKTGASTDDLLGAMVNAEVVSTNALPRIEDVAELIAKPIILPEDVIEGVLHRGAKMVLGGASKSFKTWTLVDLAISVASGASWLGTFATRRGHVLYINLELASSWFSKRVKTVCDERQISLESGYLRAWNLRGYAADLSRLLPQLLIGIAPDEYVLIVIDPIYKLLGLRDENKAGDIATLLNEIESLAVQTGAAVAFGAHYSKGNQSQKESIDRIGGSGVFARDPDSILNFTRHEQADCFTVEAVLRNHPPIEPFVVRWEYPLMCVENALDPARLKQGGAPKLYDADGLLELLTRPMPATEFRKVAYDELGMSERTFYRLFAELKQSGAVTADSDGNWKQP